MQKKDITIEDLARMVQKGFEETAKGFEETAKRVEVDQRFDKVERRLDKIEKLLIADHRQRIEKLEVEVQDLKGL